MNIRSLMNGEPAATREQTKPQQAAAPQQHAPSHPHQAHQHHAQSPVLSRTPSEQSIVHAQYHAQQIHAQHQSPPPDQLHRHQHAAHHGQPLRHTVQSPGGAPGPGFHPPPPPLDTRGAGYPPQHSPARTPHLQQSGQPQTPSYPFPPRFPSPSQTRGGERPYAGTPGQNTSQPYGALHAASPSAYPPQRPPLSSHSSASATPSSSYTQSPHAVRDPSIPPSHHHPAYRSQPGTPLGPPAPQLPHERSYPSRPDPGPYPQHHRTLSNASNPPPFYMNSSSPGLQDRPPSHISESRPGIAHLPLQTKRVSSEQVPQISERERSLSVSPKTQVGTRTASNDQRYTSQDALHSARGSIASQPSHGAPSPAPMAQLLREDVRPLPPSAKPSSYEATKFDGSPNVQSSYQPGPPGGEQLLQQPVSHSPHGPMVDSAKLKRRAESPVAPQEQKKPRVQRSEPPIWARLHPSNPGYDRQNALHPRLKGQPSSVVEKIAPAPSQSVAPARSSPKTNGHAPPAQESDSASKKARISGILGAPWEVSVTETIPADRLLHQVAEFLYITMLSNPNLGAGDARNGALEIEAKVGTLVDKNNNERLNLPITTPCALHEGFSKSHVRFESFITEMQFKSFNKTLNRWAQGTHEPGRVRMDYAHRYEQDSFSTLSKAGLDALPASAKQHLAQHPPVNPLRLRTTVNKDPKLKPPASSAVLAQIIKLRLADLDIFCPGDAFDVRISVNIEIDLHNRPDVDASLLTTPAEQRAGDRERNKNRLSYRHLTSGIDLTQVTYDASGVDKTHELEVEVDTVALRSQAQLLKEGKDNAFEAVVEKFWSDVLLLVRVREEPGDGA